MADEFWQILKSQPGVGVLIIDINGRVLFCNEQARRIYYGSKFNPVGMTIEEVEGREFAAERMAVIRRVIETGTPMTLRHIRGGLHTEALIWPLEKSDGQEPRIMAVTRQGPEVSGQNDMYDVFESQLVDLGPLDVLTRREVEVLALIGHGTPLKSAARELGVAQRTVERYRKDIARKLNVNSIAEIAQIVQLAGLETDDAQLPRLHRWRKPAE
ncbi:MAG: PAS domain-containing protein [Planctomycetaceae bacterium]|nr:PAS domain-containing protein [Planctomycetaceae bacterium]